MTTITELREGIATNLATIPGLRTFAFVPDDPKPPIAVVLPDTVSFDTAFNRGLDTYNFTVQLLVTSVSDRSAQTSIDAYLNPSGPSSVKQAIERDKTLGGKAQSLRVESIRNYRRIDVTENQYLSAEFVVSVYA